MKRKVALAVTSVALTLGLAGFALFHQVPSSFHHSELGASLSGAASLDDGPLPDVDSSYDLSAHQTLSRVVLLIREHYVDPARVEPYDMFLAALDTIQRTVPEVMIDDSQAPRRVTVSVGPASQSFDLGGLDQLWEVTMALRDIFRFLQAKIDESDKRRDIEYAAINGMLSTLDPHSVLLKPASFDEVKLSTKGEFGGLGIVISIRDGSLTIISPIVGTPASRAGLKAKDKIVKIGEESTINMSLEEAVQRLRGRPGTKIAVWVLRKKWTEPRRFMLTRAIIKIESVTSELLDDKIGYIRIKSFQNNTYDDLHTHLQKLRRRVGGELKGLVLDLRNNPGGLLDQAILISDRFIERGPLVITVGEGRKKRDVKSAHFSGTEGAYPIAVLVNGGSASASEIVSGALKNHDRALTIGQQTFGKGSVQVLYDFKDRSALKLTIAQYLTPGDISIQSVGITPDVEIVPAFVSKESLHLFADNDAPREKDLDKHLERHRRAQATPRGERHEPEVRIVHVVPEEDPEPLEDVDPDAFEVDFEIGLAHELLSRTTATDRKVMIRQARGLFDERREKQDQVIATRLEAVGVDWSKGESTAWNRASLSLEIEGKGSADLVAGQEAAFTATVTNGGDRPLYRAYAVTETDNPLFNHLEFAFGKVEPGASKSWTTKVKLPKDFHDRADRIILKLGHDGAEIQSVTTRSYVSIRSLDRPRFAYQYYFDDRERGNGDGVPQVGEPVSLKVEVTNLGPGNCSEAMVTAKNLSGRALFLDRGRARIEDLKPGETMTGVLKFTARSAEEPVKLRLAVWDTELGAHMAQTVEVPVAAARKVKKEVRGLKVSKKADAPIYAGASEDMPILAWAKAGVVLRADAAVAGKWRRVEARGGVPGFVRVADVQVLRSPRRQAGGAVRAAASESPPKLKLHLSRLLTRDDSLRLKGVVSDEGALIDMFVFVNDKKVFYKAFEQPVADAGTEVPIDLLLPLKEGSNAVAVVVRETNDLIARRIFGVFRDDPKAMAADAAELKTNAQ